MIQNESTRVWVNRILAFMVGGLLLFLIMNYSVAEKLRNELDESQYAAGRLLSDAKANIDNKRYDRAMKSLDALVEKHPGSQEAVEGNTLYEVIETAVRTDEKIQKELDLRWEQAVEGVRKEWEIETAAGMREKIANEREQLEKDMNELLTAEWDKNKDKIRTEWEKTQGEA